MAIKFGFRGGAAALAQVSTATINSSAGGQTFILKVGGITIASISAADGVVNTTAAALYAARVQTHPYAKTTVFTISVAANVLTFAAVVAGVPFVVVASGTGSMTVATTTASTGPCDYSTKSNWIEASTGFAPTVLPGDASSSNDQVVFEDSAYNCVYGLDQSAITNAISLLDVRATFTGKIGLNYAVFALSADGETTDPTVPEYRDTYLRLKVQQVSATAEAVWIGRHDGPGSPSGSPRICLDTGTTATTINVLKTAAVSSETSRPAVRLKCVATTTHIYVTSAPAGVGLATDRPGEVSTCGIFSVADKTANSRCFTGTGVTISTRWEQYGGSNILQHVPVGTAACPEADIYGGTLRTEGDFQITALTNIGGLGIINNYSNTGAAVTIAQNKSGTLDASQSTRLRTWTTWKPVAGTLIANNSLTITTRTGPDYNQIVTAWTETYS